MGSVGCLAVALLVVGLASPMAARAAETFGARVAVSPWAEVGSSLLPLDPGWAEAPILGPRLSVWGSGGGSVPEDPGTVRSWLPLILLVGATAGLYFGVSPLENPRWDSSNGFDDSVRSGLRLNSEKARGNAGDVSSALVAGNALLLMSDWVLERRAYPLTESVRTDATWVLSNTFVTRGLKLVTGRARPFTAECATGVAAPGLGVCESDNAGFPSGHASLSATLAGLLCARRLHRPERSFGDLLLCGGASSLAVATGILRISADEHYATDVLAGWASGLVFGYLLPSHFHYRKRDGREQAVRPPAHLITPIVGSDLWGLRYDVTF